MCLKLQFMTRMMNMVSGKSVPVEQNVYDNHGALIEVKNMDKDRNLINHPETGVAITEYKYDELGNRTETLRFDKDRVAGKQCRLHCNYYHE